MPPKRSNTGRRTRRANRDQESRANESDEQTASRLEQVRLATNTRRSAESPADRESRLAAREMEKFTHCCEKGKVKLPDIKIPSQIQNLLIGDDSSSKNFLDRIRQYNSAFAFASTGAQITAPPGRGPYCFRIHGQVYHRTSPLHPAEGRKPKFIFIFLTLKKP